MRRALTTGLVLVVAAAVVIALLSGTGVIGGGGSSYQVEALFDNAGFAVPGEQVRIAGAPVGTISGLAVTRQNLAAVTLSITDRAFTPWRANASCTIRPQSLIAERYVDCTPGTIGHASLKRIQHGYGAGSYLLPVSRTSSPIDPDIVQDISQESVRESLSLILDELGTGLAARGSDLNAVILRADPALARTDQVFKILSSQNRVLARLATDSNAVLGPLAKVRRQLADFVVQANTTASATATQSAQLSQSIRLLPSFLSQLKPLMADLGQLADQGTPVMSDLGDSAGSLDAEFKSLTPFAQQARSALVNLGNAAQQSQSSLIASQPLVNQLGQLGAAAEPSAAALQSLTSSLSTTGGIQQLMGLLFYGASATNGYDADGHYVRVAPVVGSCNAYAKVPVAGCLAKFIAATSSSEKSSAAPGTTESLATLRRQAEELSAYASQLTASESAGATTTQAGGAQSAAETETGSSGSVTSDPTTTSTTSATSTTSSSTGANETALVAAEAVHRVLGGRSSSSASTAALSALLRYLIGSGS